jgi:quercetin dioxygenase-like cupin family protein
MGKNMTTERQKAVFNVQFDNDRTIVRQWIFASGSETGWHSHDHDFIVVPQTKGTLLLQTADVESSRVLESGSSYFRNAGIKHNAINTGEDEIVLLEIELKPKPLK